MIIFERIFDFLFNDILASIFNTIWGLRVLCLLLIIFIIILFKYKNKILLKTEIINHDKRIFTESNSILNEQTITDFLTKIEYRVIEEDTEGHFFSKYLDFFDNVSNKYLNRKIYKSLINVYTNFNSLRDFIGKHFMDKQGKANGRLFFEPDIKYVHPNVQYEQYFNEMISISNSAKKAYSSYRLIIKKKLLI